MGVSSPAKTIIAAELAVNFECVLIHFQSHKPWEWSWSCVVPNGMGINPVLFRISREHIAVTVQTTATAEISVSGIRRLFNLRLALDNSGVTVRNSTQKCPRSLLQMQFATLYLLLAMQHIGTTTWPKLQISIELWEIKSAHEGSNNC